MVDIRPREPIPLPALIHPAIETIHLLGTLAGLYILAIYWRILSPPEFFTMQGFPDSLYGSRIVMYSLVNLLEYPAIIVAVSGRWGGKWSDSNIPLSQRVKQARQVRLSVAIGTLFFAALCFMILLGVIQKSRGIDFQQRWPVDESSFSL
jgi:hypothetical protein